MNNKFGLTGVSILFVLSMLAACGGGGDGGGSAGAPSSNGGGSGSGSAAAPPPDNNSVGRFAYVANYGDDNVSAYSIDAATGALTEVAGRPFAAEGVITVDPSGKFAYVSNWDSGNISAFTINATTGALTGIGAVPAGNNPTSFTITRGSQ